METCGISPYAAIEGVEKFVSVLTEKKVMTITIRSTEKAAVASCG